MNAREESEAMVRRLVAIYKPQARNGMNPQDMHRELRSIEAPRPLAEKEIEEIVFVAYHPRNIHP